jgi:hypothetical protein
VSPDPCQTFLAQSGHRLVAQQPVALPDVINGRFAGRRAFATGGYRAPCGDRPKGEGMIGRLGEVLYWIAVGLGAILALLGIALLIFGVDLTAKFMGGVSIVAGIAIYGIGRASLYVLAGR